MATNFPNNLDVLTNPTASDSVVAVSHASQHANANDAIEALQAKVGANSSEVTTSHDYKLSSVNGSAKAVASDTYASDKAGLEASINANASAITTKVGKTGDESITGIKNFTSSPIVPDPTNDTDATNKQWVEGYVEGVGKENVGLLTQGKFVDSLTTNLKISVRQTSTETAHSGLPVFDSLHTLDGVNFITARGDTNNLYVGEYSRSGAVFTPIFAQAIISGLDFMSTVVRYFDANTAIVAAVRDSSKSNVYVGLVQKSGSTWSLTTSAVYTLPGASSSTQIGDIILDGNNIYIAVVYLGIEIHILKAEAAPGSGIVAYDGLWTVPTVSIGATAYARFNSTSSIFVKNHSANTLQKYSFSSGSISSVGNTVSYNSLYFYPIEEDVLLVDNITFDTYEHDGTDFNLVSRTSANITGELYYSFDTNKAITSTHYVELGAYGLENSIEDLSASGHLRYIASTSYSGFGGQTLTLTGTDYNDGDYLTLNTDSGSVNKVLLSASPVQSETKVANIKNKITGTLSWQTKASGNYYLGTN